MAMARMRRVCLASAVRAAAARNCEILRFWRVISIADMLPAPRINDVLHRVTLAAVWESPQESGSQAVGITTRNGRIKAAGVSASRRCKHSLTPSPLRGKKRSLPDHHQQRTGHLQKGTVCKIKYTLLQPALIHSKASAHCLDGRCHIVERRTREFCVPN